VGAVLDKIRYVLGRKFGKVQVSNAEPGGQKLLGKSVKVLQGDFREAALPAEVAPVII
jgi:hypothetical protein